MWIALICLREVFKNNPSIFGNACMFAERIGCLDDFVHKSGGSSNCKNGYAPMELDEANAQPR